jgi:diacylglycerol kinase family enzyme
LKRVLGRVGYLVWALWCLLRYRAFHLTIEEENGQRHKLWATEVRIANGRFHGGVELIEDASVHSGEVVVQAVAGRSILRLLWNWVAGYFKLPARKAEVVEFHGRRLHIDTRPRQRISIDGEVLAKTPATAAVAERAIEIVVPC